MIKEAAEIIEFAVVLPDIGDDVERLDSKYGISGICSGLFARMKIEMRYAHYSGAAGQKRHAIRVSLYFARVFSYQYKEPLKCLGYVIPKKEQ